MTHGVDTDFLVAAEIIDHPFHRSADQLLTRLLSEGHDFALAPQTLAEFIHIVSDARRMPKPLTVSEAIAKTEEWWNASEVVRVFPNDHAVSQFLRWHRSHRIGRKRLQDTLLAATFKAAAIEKLVTNNASDYQVFGCFEIIVFR